ncbi:riboflavin synthase [Halostella salina]|uniref:riboflavin synthase n=1 Tax=Halostella salina TaxID=1547897 RepID=UPI000EF7FD4C|nr:riboflavin synthase [Halostella salina]
MYTGVVETTGELRAKELRDGGCRLRIGTDTSSVAPDDSVGIQGVCLTAERVGDGWFEAFCSPETVERTYLAALDPGAPVNVETPVSPGGTLDGHVVKGTVDTVTEVTAVEPDGDGWRYEFAVPEGYGRFLVEKGSVAVDGISLTVAAVGDGTFEAAVIPATREITTLSEKAVGDPVHFEADLLAKYAQQGQTAGTT